MKAVIVNLAKYLAEPEEIREWSGVPIEEFMKKDDVVKAVRGASYCWTTNTDGHFQSNSQRTQKHQYGHLFSLPEERCDFITFTENYR